MFPAIKLRDFLLLLLFFYLYQMVWLLTLSVVYTTLHEPFGNVWNNLILAINPKTVIAYTVILYPISIACLVVFIGTTIIIKSFKHSGFRTFLVSTFVIILVNFLNLIIYSLIGSSYKDLFNWISSNWNVNMKTGLYGYILGSIVFMLLYIPLIRYVNSHTLRDHSTG